MNGPATPTGGMTMAQRSTNSAAQPDLDDSSVNKQATPGETRPPWRVEGARPPDRASLRRPPYKRPSLWALLAVLLLIDWIMVIAYQPSLPTRVTVPYSYFVRQIDAGNVASVTAQGSDIEGTFRHSVTYPAHGGTATALFSTERPAFADDPLLSTLLK